MRKLAVLMLLAVVIAACGKKGPLVYPEMLVPAAPSGVAAQQIGSSLKLSFILPSRDRAGRSLSNMAGVTVLKRDEPVGQSQGCSACTTDFFLFRKLNLDVLVPGVQRYGNLLVLLDGDVQSGRTYTYRVSVFTNNNQEGALSAPVSSVIVPPILPPVVHVTSQPTEIQLEFAGLLSHREDVVVGYNVYRALKGAAFPLLPLNSEPLVANRFVDVGLERGTTYVYGVRQIARLPSGGMVESGLSNEVEGKLKDDE